MLESAIGLSFQINLWTTLASFYFYFTSNPSATAGIVLAVLVISKGKNGKRYLSSVLLVTGLGSVLLSPATLAVTNIELAAYNQLLN